MSTVQIAIPEKLKQIFMGDADVRGSYGGRGSAKTRSFAKMCAVKGYIYAESGIQGQLLCARQFMNSLDDSSLEELKRAIQDEPFLDDYYEIGDKFIRTKNRLVEFSFCGLDRNISSIKSKGRILLCWVDEAESVTDTAWQTLIPTLREEGDDWNAELWVTWNPLREGSPTDKRFKNTTDPRYKIVELNWRDNPKFPAILERQRQRDLVERPDQYPHIWEGDYLRVMVGAYFAMQLTRAKQTGRLTVVYIDPLMTVYAFWDIGGTGAKADACAIWIAQFIGLEIRVLDYHEAVGQELSYHINWLRENDYDRSLCVLPHDAEQHEKVESRTYEGAIKKAGFKTHVIPNQGTGAAKQRIEAARRLFPSMIFDKENCDAGLKALGWYHEKIDEKRQVGLGPCHDWSSHGADAFGLMAVAYEIIMKERKTARPPQVPKFTAYDSSVGY